MIENLRPSIPVGAEGRRREASVCQQRHMAPVQSAHRQPVPPPRRRVRTGRDRAAPAAPRPSGATPQLISRLSRIRAPTQHDGLLPPAHGEPSPRTAALPRESVKPGSGRRQQARAALILKDPLDFHTGNLASLKSLCIHSCRGSEISARIKNKRDCEQKRPFRLYSVHRFPEVTLGHNLFRFEITQSLSVCFKL